MKWVALLLFFFLISSAAEGQEKRILIDTAHDNNDYAVRQLKKIFGEESTDTPPFFPINYQMLQNYDIFVITSPRLDYLPSEIVSLCIFVQKGGTLIVFSNGSHARNVNEVLSCFGVQINRDVVGGFSDTTMQGTIQIDDLHFDNPSSLEISGPWDTVVSTDMEGYSLRIDASAELYNDYLKPRGSRPVVAAFRRMGEGVIAVVGEIPNFSYSQNQELVRAVSCLTPPKTYDERLDTYERIFEYQKQIEGINYKRIPLQSSLNLEKAWVSYYENEDEEAERFVSLGKAALREDRGSWKFLFVPILAFVAILFSARYLKINLTRERLVCILGILALFSSSLFVVVYFDFFSIVVKVALLLVVFIFAAKTREKRFLFQLGLYCLLLSSFYFSGFPASSTLGPYYSPEKLILPESVPIVLVAQDVANLKSIGAIQDEIEYVENLTNARIKYRTEDQNFFPTPVATTRHREGNCFRQALYASSILINLGYDAYVASGIDHAWVEVEGRGILFPKLPPFLRFNEHEISLEYFPSGAFLVLIFLSLMIAYWPAPTGETIKDTLILGGFSLLFTKIITESAYIPYHLYIITLPLYFLLLRFASKKKNFNLTSTQQLLLKFTILFICFFVFIVFPLIGTVTRVLTPTFMIIVFPLLITIFMAIFAELFVGISLFPRQLQETLKRKIRLRKE